ncbi:hypothetical protein MANES_16G058404v8 [Manihot esculenta]|uniref:Uncharacterized protein n=1 Tax=Manihot esculenta TaxID=3983 RepID=A0ACB7G7E6_MANES|nr:hypothetical protein MANES_16G058404v8 [Manihot esculenta]
MLIENILSRIKIAKIENNLDCSYCGKTGHLKQRCYDIIDYREWWGFTKKPRKKVAGTPMIAATIEVQQNMEDKSQPIANITHPRQLHDASATPKWTKGCN